MNSISRGQVKLTSSDPNDPPSIDPRYLSHPFDLVNLREGLREALDLMQTPTMKEHFVAPVFAPKSSNDDDLVEFIEESVAGLWHPSCSVKMGKSEMDGSCVDRDLKLHGIGGLRVADLSVTPILPSGRKCKLNQDHPPSLSSTCATVYLNANAFADPQIIAYAIGQVAAEKIAQDHKL